MNLRFTLTLCPALLLLCGIGFGFSSFANAQSQQLEQRRDAVPAQDLSKPKEIPKEKAKSKVPPTSFLRVQKSEQGTPLSMQTAITRYRPEMGELVIDLIGAVHIGEGKYYEQLNRQFELYDVVLYELVAPKGTRVPKGGKKTSGGLPSSPMDLVGWMQGQAQSQLGLESQLALIDYQKSNFTHADLSPKQMGEKMAQRGDTPLTVGLSAITEMLRNQNRAASSSTSSSSLSRSDQTEPESLMDMLGSPLKMKLVMANQFASSGVMDSGLGARFNQLLITDRNEAAMKVLQKEITQGKKKIAIFYGAAHMPDFEKRLQSEFGLNKTKQIWVDAWDLTTAPKNSTKSTTEMLFNLLDELGK